MRSKSLATSSNERWTTMTMQMQRLPRLRGDASKPGTALLRCRKPTEEVAATSNALLPSRSMAYSTTSPALEIDGAIDPSLTKQRMKRLRTSPARKKARLESQSVLEYADATIPSGFVASVIMTETVQSNGLNIHATEFVPGKVETVNFVRVYQAVDSSGTADPAETPSLVGGCPKWRKRRGFPNRRAGDRR